MSTIQDQARQILIDTGLVTPPPNFGTINVATAPQVAIASVTPVDLDAVYSDPGFISSLSAAKITGILDINQGGTGQTTAQAASPEGYTGSITFNQPLALSSDNYAVILTTEGATSAYAMSLSDNGDDKFSGFSFFMSDEGNLHYLVVRKGILLEEN